jgi:hypothetical protein
MLPRHFRAFISASGRMNDMVNAPDASRDDPCTVTRIRAINGSGEGLVELEITVDRSQAGLWKDSPAEHPWYGHFLHRVRRAWNQGQMASDPDGSIRFNVPRGQLEDFTRAVRQAARDADADYQAMLSQHREWTQRDAQTRHERQADPARRARLTEDQARIDAALAGTEQ